MKIPPDGERFDVIVIGSGPSGATIARELSRHSLRVLVLEAGAGAPKKETTLGFPPIATPVAVGHKVRAMSASVTGGATALYFAVADFPPLDTFNALGIDLSQAVAEVKQELPLATLPDKLLGNQAILVRDSARSLGYAWKQNLMLVDQSRLGSGSGYDAKWKATDYLAEARALGTSFYNLAKVLRIIVKNGKAVGVEFKLRTGVLTGKRRTAYANKIVVAAGAFSSPLILRNSGIKNIVNRGFQLNPTFTLFANVPGLQAGDNFPGSMHDDLGNGISLGDANVSRTLYKMMMLDNKKIGRIFSYSSSVAVAVKVSDSTGGELKANGKYDKTLSRTELNKLDEGERLATDILRKAGGKGIFRSSIFSAGFSGLVRVNENVDCDLQTEIPDLYLCDASLMPEDVRIPPAITIICLAKYFANRLRASL